MVEGLILVAVVGLALVFARRRKAQQYGALARAVHALAIAPVTLEKPADGDAQFMGVLQGVAREEVELRKRKFVPIGDLITARGIPGPRGAMRVMASEDRQVQVRLLVTSMTTTESIVIVSASHAGDEVLTTRYPDLGGGLLPPHIDRQDVEMHVALPDMLDMHRARLTKLSDRVEFRDVDDVLASHRAARARTLAWRTTEDPEALFEADLRRLLGKRFHKHGPMVMAAARRLVFGAARPDMPRAVAMPKREP